MSFNEKYSDQVFNMKNYQFDEKYSDLVFNMQKHNEL